MAALNLDPRAWLAPDVAWPAGAPRWALYEHWTGAGAKSNPSNATLLKAATAAAAKLAVAPDAGEPLAPRRRGRRGAPEADAAADAPIRNKRVVREESPVRAGALPVAAGENGAAGADLGEADALLLQALREQNASLQLSLAASNARFENQRLGGASAAAEAPRAEPAVAREREVDLDAALRNFRQELMQEMDEKLGNSAALLQRQLDSARVLGGGQRVVDETSAPYALQAYDIYPDLKMFSDLPGYALFVELNKICRDWQSVFMAEDSGRRPASWYVIQDGERNKHEALWVEVLHSMHAFLPPAKLQLWATFARDHSDARAPEALQELNAAMKEQQRSQKMQSVRAQAAISSSSASSVGTAPYLPAHGHNSWKLTAGDHGSGHRGHQSAGVAAAPARTGPHAGPVAACKFCAIGLKDPSKPCRQHRIKVGEKYSGSRVVSVGSSGGDGDTTAHFSRDYGKVGARETRDPTVGHSGPCGPGPTGDYFAWGPRKRRDGLGRVSDRDPSPTRVAAELVPAQYEQPGGEQGVRNVSGGGASGQLARRHGFAAGPHGSAKLLVSHSEVRRSELSSSGRRAVGERPLFVSADQSRDSETYPTSDAPGVVYDDPRRAGSIPQFDDTSGRPFPLWFDSSRPNIRASGMPVRLVGLGGVVFSPGVGRSGSVSTGLVYGMESGPLERRHHSDGRLEGGSSGAAGPLPSDDGCAGRGNGLQQGSNGPIATSALHRSSFRYSDKQNLRDRESLSHYAALADRSVARRVLDDAGAAADSRATLCLEGSCSHSCDCNELPVFTDVSSGQRPYVATVGCGSRGHSLDAGQIATLEREGRNVAQKGESYTALSADGCVGHGDGGLGTLDGSPAQSLGHRWQSDGHGAPGVFDGPRANRSATSARGARGALPWPTRPNPTGFSSSGTRYSEGSLAVRSGLARGTSDLDMGGYKRLRSGEAAVDSSRLEPGGGRAESGAELRPRLGLDRVQKRVQSDYLPLSSGTTARPLCYDSQRPVRPLDGSNVRDIGELPSKRVCSGVDHSFLGGSPVCLDPAGGAALARTSARWSNNSSAEVAAEAMVDPVIRHGRDGPAGSRSHGTGRQSQRDPCGAETAAELATGRLVRSADMKRVSTLLQSNGRGGQSAGAGELADVGLAAAATLTRAERPGVRAASIQRLREMSLRPGTHRAYEPVWKRYVQFMQDEQELSEQVLSSSFDAHYDSVLDFVLELLHAGEGASVGKVLPALRLYATPSWSSGQEQDLLKVVKGAKAQWKLSGATKHQRRDPMPWSAWSDVCKTLPVGWTYESWLRRKAMFAIILAFVRRPQEVMGVRMCDVIPTPGRPGAVSLRFTAAKNDSLGADFGNTWICLEPVTAVVDRLCCPATAILAWLARRLEHIAPNEWFFPRLTGGPLAAMPAELADATKALVASSPSLRARGLHLTPYSWRIAAATRLLELGATTAVIKTMGGWRGDSFLRYLRLTALEGSGLRESMFDPALRAARPGDLLKV